MDHVATLYTMSVRSLERERVVIQLALLPNRQLKINPGDLSLLLLALVAPPLHPTLSDLRLCLLVAIRLDPLVKSLFPLPSLAHQHP